MSSLTSTEREALNRFTRQARQTLTNRVNTVRLFGSKARGDARKFSDVDVLVVLDHPNRQDALTLHAIANKVFLETDVDLSLKVLTAEAVRRMRAGGSPFIAAVDREGIAL